MPRASPEILARSYDPDPAVRREAVRELCPCRVKSEDPDPRLRRNVRKALARYRRTGRIDEGGR